MPESYLLIHFKGLASKVLPNVTLNGVKGLGVVGSMRGMPSPAPRFFVTSFLRKTYKAKPTSKEKGEDIAKRGSNLS